MKKQINLANVMTRAWELYKSVKNSLFSECLKEAWKEAKFRLTQLGRLLSSAVGRSTEFEFGSKTRSMKLEGLNFWAKKGYRRVYLDLDGFATAYVVLEGTTRDAELFEVYDEDDNEYKVYGSVSGNSERKRDNVREAVENLLLGI